MALDGQLSTRPWVAQPLTEETAMIGRKLPDVTFKTRVRDESVGGPNPFRWQDKTTADYFKGKRVVLFSLPGAFTRQMGMLVCKDNLGFGMRSWRYAAVIDDGVVEAWFEEPGFSDLCETDPYGESSPQNVLEKLARTLKSDRSAA